MAAIPELSTLVDQRVDQHFPLLLPSGGTGAIAACHPADRWMRGGRVTSFEVGCVSARYLHDPALLHHD